MSDRGDEDAFGEAVYSAWRRGLNPDRVDRDSVAQYYEETRDPYDAAALEVQRLERIDQRRRDEADEPPR